MISPCEGYAHTTSLYAGESLHLHLALAPDAPGQQNAETVNIGVFYTGCEDLDLSLLTFPVQVSLAPAPPPRAWEGLDWPCSASVATQPDWPSGLYVVAPIGYGDILCFVLRPPKPRSRLLVQVSFLTPLAYCNRGGKSLYAYNSQGAPACTVGFDRPGALPYPEYALSAWLARQQIEADWCSSLDLHREPDLLDHYDCLVLGGHAEYWTAALRAHLTRFVTRGGCLLVLSGNTGYRQVRLSDDLRRMSYHQRPDLDPGSDDSLLAVGWSEPPLAQPINHLLGAGWLHGAYCGGEAGEGGAIPSAYRCHFPGHWVFEGVWSKADSAAGHFETPAFMHYETDAAAFAMSPAGYPVVTGQDGSPTSCVVLASADLRHWPGRPGWATMSLCSVGQGWVFHGGTTEWLNRLEKESEPPASQESGMLSRITRNVLRRFLHGDAGAPAPWTRVGGTPQLQGLTRHGQQLLMLGHDGQLWWREPVGAQITPTAAGIAPPHCGSLCSDGQALWALDSQGEVFYSSDASQPLVSSWQHLPGQAGSPAARLAQLVCLAQVLYAVDSAGCCWRRPASSLSPAGRPWKWTRLNLAALPGRLHALALRDMHLLALVELTESGQSQTQLWRNQGGFIEESAGWVCLAVWPAWAVTSLAVFDDMLYLGDAGQQLYWAPSAALTGRAPYRSRIRPAA